MPITRSSSLLAAGLVIGLAVGGGAVALASASSPTVKVCVTKKQVVRSANANGSCPTKTRKKKISVTGPAGPAGAPGSATAWGQYNGYLQFPIVAKSANVAAITRFQDPAGPTSAFYCVTFTSPITLAQRQSAVFSNVYSQPPPQNDTRATDPFCPDGLRVRINDISGPGSQGTFTFLVP